MFTGLPLYIGIGALVVIVGLTGALWVQTSRVEAKQETIKAMELVAQAWEQKTEVQRANIEKLKAAIAEQNKMIEEMARWGELAEERQRTIDALMAKLARAEDDLRIISDKYREMREQSTEWTVCQTYEHVLQSLAGEVSP